MDVTKAINDIKAGKIEYRLDKTNIIQMCIRDSAGGWHYIMKNGRYAGATWIQDTDGKWYYINIGTYMETDDITPDGY